MASPMQVAVLAGGLASRMRPRTETSPKYLLEVAGRPFADHQLTWLAEAGADEVVLLVGHLGDAVRAHVGDGSRFGVPVRYVDEGANLRGTAGALRLAADEGVLGDQFLVLYGDSYLAVDIREVWEEFLARRPDALMCTFRNQDRWDASNASVRDGLVVRYEKGVPDPLAEGMDQIDYGLSALTRAVIEEMVATATTVDLASVYAALAREGRLAAHEVTERFYEIGSPDGLAELDALLRRRIPEGSA